MTNRFGVDLYPKEVRWAATEGARQHGSDFLLSSSGMIDPGNKPSRVRALENSKSRSGQHHALRQTDGRRMRDKYCENLRAKKTSSRPCRIDQRTLSRSSEHTAPQQCNRRTLRRRHVERID
jgi:hypothetical protein